MTNTATFVTSGRTIHTQVRFPYVLITGGAKRRFTSFDVAKAARARSGGRVFFDYAPGCGVLAIRDCGTACGVAA